MSNSHRSGSPGQDDVASVLDELGLTFNLDFPIGDGTIGSKIQERLESLVSMETPSWGTPGQMKQISLENAGALRFYYRPHLFPTMSEPLRLGHALQFDLLPRTLPVDSPLQIAALLESYCHLSGDLIGWHKDGSDLVVWVADVSGHGVRAGLAAAVMYFLIGTLEPSLTPEELLRQLNQRMVDARRQDDPQALYLTAFVARLHRSGSGAYASAGHPDILLRRADGSVERLPSTGLPIGVFGSTDYESDSLQMRPCDNLILFTDGVIEVKNRDANEFGRDRLNSALEGVGSEPDDVIRAIYDRVTLHCPSHELDDDMTLLAARLIEP